LIRRIEPWEIPAAERATVGRVLEQLARHLGSDAHPLREANDRYQQSEAIARELGVSDVVDELRAYAREILSWSENYGSPCPNDRAGAAAQARGARPE
jgi:hypothetical protein